MHVQAGTQVLQGTLKQLEDRAAGALKQIDASNARVHELEADYESFEKTDKALQIAFPVSIAAGVGAAFLFDHGMPLLMGLVAAAGSHLSRVACSGIPVGLLDETSKLRTEVRELAAQAQASTEEAAQLRARIEETGQLVDALSGRISSRLGIYQDGKTVTVGAVRLPKRES